MFAERIRRLRASWNALVRRGVLARSVAFVTIIALTITAFGGLITMVTRQSSSMIALITERHEPERAAMDRVAENLFALNNRLLGVMADVYSAPGSVDRVAQYGQEIVAGWQDFAALRQDDLGLDALVRAKASVDAIPDFIARLTAELRKGGTVGGYYDEWLDLSHPVRTLSREVAASLTRDVQDFSVAMRETERWVVAMTATALVVGFTAVLLIAVGLIGGVVRPIGRLTAAMVHLAEGAVETEIPAARRRDEIGAMARAVEVFKRSMVENMAVTAAEKVEAQAKIDRAQRIDLAIREFETTVSGIVRELGATADETYASAEMLSGTAMRVSGRSAEVSAASDATTSDVQTVATAAEQLSAAVASIGEFPVVAAVGTVVAVNNSGANSAFM